MTEFNERLRARAESTFDQRKSQLLENRQLLHDLGVPVRKSKDVPSTFSIDAPKRRLITKPEAPSSDYEPEPALHEKGYSQILEVIQHVGREMERHPATYAGQGEEMLRDFLLMALTPNFESTTGETFNKAGKTDILIGMKARMSSLLSVRSGTGRRSTWRRSIRHSATSLGETPKRRS